MQQETIKWLTIKGYPDYEISSIGQIRRITRSGSNKFKNIPLPYMIRQHFHKYGYPQIHIFPPNQKYGKTLCVHHLMGITFLGDPPEGKCLIAHFDGNPKNNNLSNLRWASTKENSQDALRHGRIHRGKDVYTAKLTEDQVLSIKMEHSSLPKNGRLIFLTKKHKIPRGTIVDIIAGKTWLHVTKMKQYIQGEYSQLKACQAVK